MDYGILQFKPRQPWLIQQATIKQHDLVYDLNLASELSKDGICLIFLPNNEKSMNETALARYFPLSITKQWQDTVSVQIVGPLQLSSYQDMWLEERFVPPPPFISKGKDSLQLTNSEKQGAICHHGSV